MNTNHSNIVTLMNEAETLGKNALVDPVPEMSNPESLPHRAETMRAYFMVRIDALMDEFNSLPEEDQEGLSSFRMRELIVESMRKGFLTLILDQPSHKLDRSTHHDLSHDPSEMLEFTEEVFQTIRDPHRTFPEHLQFSGGKIHYRLRQKR